jgi:hypothetical protein
MLVVGVTGCTCAGKSALARGLAAARPGSVIVALDDYRIPPEGCAAAGVPPLDLSALPWPSGQWPKVMSSFSEKRWDTNVPAWIDWPSALRAIKEVKDIAKARGCRTVFVEGFLLATQPKLLAILDAVIVLESSDGGETEMRRKYTRSGHLTGRSSYKEKGVSSEDFRVYWEHYVYRRYRKFAPGAEPLPGRTARISSSRTRDEVLDEALAALARFENQSLHVANAGKQRGEGKHVESGRSFSSAFSSNSCHRNKCSRNRKAPALAPDEVYCAVL